MDKKYVTPPAPEVCDCPHIVEYGDYGDLLETTRRAGGAGADAGALMSAVQ
jgi:hypothetical protein